MSIFKRHPFPVAAYFKQSLVLTFALSPEALVGKLPPPLRLDTFEDRHAFVAVAMVQTEALRPKGFPRWLGNDFFLAGYRIFVRYTNLMTLYNYSKIEVDQAYGEEAGMKTYRINSSSEGFSVKVRYEDDPALPTDSPFIDWKQARRFAGPLPFTFTYDAERRNVLIVEGVRQNWKPRPVTVEHFTLPWLNRKGLGDAVLASAFVVEDIPYWWRKGKIEPWQK